MKHTPTPWKIVARSADPLDVSKRMIEDSQGRFIVKTGTTVHISLEQQAANAAFIVRAVNCHYELVNSLKQIKSQLTAIDGLTHQEEFILSIAQQAIAKAEGK